MKKNKVKLDIHVLNGSKLKNHLRFLWRIIDNIGYILYNYIRNTEEDL